MFKTLRGLGSLSKLFGGNIQVNNSALTEAYEVIFVRYDTYLKQLTASSNKQVEPYQPKSGDSLFLGGLNSEKQRELDEIILHVKERLTLLAEYLIATFPEMPAKYQEIFTTAVQTLQTYWYTFNQNLRTGLAPEQSPNFDVNSLKSFFSIHSSVVADLDNRQLDSRLVQLIERRAKQITDAKETAFQKTLFIELLEVYYILFEPMLSQSINQDSIANNHVKVIDILTACAEQAGLTNASHNEPNFFRKYSIENNRLFTPSAKESALWGVYNACVGEMKAIPQPLVKR